jgi:hypothetical protein
MTTGTIPNLPPSSQNSLDIRIRLSPFAPSWNSFSVHSDLFMACLETFAWEGSGEPLQVTQHSHRTRKSESASGSNEKKELLGQYLV